MERELKFRRGYVFFENLQVYFASTNYFLIFFDYIFKKYSKEESLEIFRDVSLIDSRILYNSISKNHTSKIQMINEFLEIINNLGFGIVKLTYFSDKKLIFILNNHFISNHYCNLFGYSPKVFIEEFLFGFVKNFVSFVFGKKLNLASTKTNNSLFLQLDLLDEDFEFLSLPHHYSQMPNSEITQSLKQVLLNKGITSSNGNVKLLKMNYFVMPYFSFFSFLNYFDTIEDIEFLKDLGMLLGKNIVTYHRKLYDGSPNKMLRRVMDLSDVSGMGKFIVKKNNINTVHLEFGLSTHLANFFPDDVIWRFRYHFYSISRGVYENVFDKHFKVSVFDNKIKMTVLNSIRPVSDFEKENFRFLTIDKTISNFFNF